MRKNFGAKPWTYPQPVFILAAYDENGTPNAMNAAWGGISEDKELSMGYLYPGFLYLNKTYLTRPHTVGPCP